MPTATISLDTFNVTLTGLAGVRRGNAYVTVESALVAAPAVQKIACVDNDTAVGPFYGTSAGAITVTFIQLDGNGNLCLCKAQRVTTVAEHVADATGIGIALVAA